MELISKISRSVALLAGLALLLMTLVGAADVIGAIAGHPVAGAYEFTESLMVAVIFLAVAAAQQRKGHIRVELLTQWLSPGAKRVFVVIGLLCSIFFFGLLAYYGWTMVARSFATGEFRQGQISFPMWPARVALAAGATLMVAQCLSELVETITSKAVGQR